MCTVVLLKALLEEIKIEPILQNRIDKQVAKSVFVSFMACQSCDVTFEKAARWQNHLFAHIQTFYPQSAKCCILYSICL